MHQYREELIKRRVRKNLTHQEVADFVSIDRSTYTRIENGQKPRIETAQALGFILKFDWKNLYK